MIHPSSSFSQTACIVIFVTMAIQNTYSSLFFDISIRHKVSLFFPIADKRQQLNALTHVFDASAVYGSSSDELKNLRQGNTRRLKEQRVGGRRLPPQDFKDCPAAKRNANRCPFLGGDGRINTTREYFSQHILEL